MARAIGVIPARAGSKGIPRKNFREFAGLPLLCWIVQAACRSRTLTDIYVSTDDLQSAEKALARATFGREKPPVVLLKRPPELADDKTPDLPVFQDLLQSLRYTGDPGEIVVHLRPTAPFVRAADIDRVVTMLDRYEWASSVRSVRITRDHPLKSYRPALARDGVPLIAPYDRPHHAANAPRQGLDPVFVAAGYVDAIRASTILEGSMDGDAIVPWFAPPQRCIELDRPNDWTHGESLAQLPGFLSC